MNSYGYLKIFPDIFITLQVSYTSRYIATFHRDTHRESNPSNETQVLQKNINIDILIIIILNKLFIEALILILEKMT